MTPTDLFDDPREKEIGDGPLLVEQLTAPSGQERSA